MAFLSLLLIPVLIAAGFLVLGKGDKITLKEFGIHMLVQVIVAGGSVYAIYAANVGDTEIWNGRVAKKTREKVSCEHSYPCNCRQVCSGSGKNQSCSTVCDTCYDHSYDVDWYLTTTNNERIYISRVNRQGTIEPPRYTKAQIGEPTAVSHRFENYIKGASSSLFKNEGGLEQFAGQLPARPQIYDYHRINQAIGLRGRDWQEAMMNLNADLGRKKEVNIILVATNNPDQKFGLALQEKWLGGKQNEVVATVSTDKSGKIQWVHVFSWSKNEILNVKLRDDLLAMEKLDSPQLTANVLSMNVKKYYERKSMEEYAYLKTAVVPTTGQWVMAMLLGLILSTILGVYFYKNDVFNEERPRRGRYGFSRRNW